MQYKYLPPSAEHIIVATITAQIRCANVAVGIDSLVIDCKRSTGHISYAAQIAIDDPVAQRIAGPTFEAEVRAFMRAGVSSMRM